MLSMLASAHPPALESPNARRLLFTLPLGATLDVELEVLGSPATALLAMSQLKPVLGWAEAAAFGNDRFEEALGHIRHPFTPKARGIYMLDWQFYLSRATYRANVRLSVSGNEQYTRSLVAGAIPNLNPRGVVGISVV